MFPVVVSLMNTTRRKSAAISANKALIFQMEK